MRRTLRRAIWIPAVLLYAAAFGASVAVRLAMPTEAEATDVGRLMKAKVRKIVRINTTEDVARALEEARRRGLKVSVAGTNHSQGGQSFYEGAIVLDMKSYNKVLDLDVERRVIRVQSGATWADVQEYANPHGLAVRTMQSSNVFSIGGSLSANVHGRDTREGPLIDSVESFRLMLADGSIRNVSRSENAELFPLVIGGFGLFGVILDADIRLTDNEVYRERTVHVDYRAFPDYVRTEILAKGDVALTLGRLSAAPDSLLSEMYVTRYEKTDVPVSAALARLAEERNVEVNRFVFGLSRKFDWGKSFFWDAQRSVYAKQNGMLLTRNNAMRPPIEFLEYRDAQKTDLLQEYFVPLDRFVPFVDGMREIVRSEELNLMNVTVRYVPQNEEAMLSYARQESLALVLLINSKRSARDVAKLEAATRRLVDLALEQGGSYYLTYQLFPTREQFAKAYPQAEAFFQWKRKWDPELRFMNEFYARYAP